MSKLTGLKSKGKDYVIGGGTFHILPLGIDDFDLFDLPENASVKESMEATMKLITKVLQQSDPEVTEDEIKKYVRLDHIKELQDAVMDVCGLKEQSGGRQHLIRERMDAIKAAREARQTEQA